MPKSNDELSIRCPEDSSHRGLRSRIVDGGYMLVCSDCGADIRMALGVDGLRKRIRCLRIKEVI